MAEGKTSQVSAIEMKSAREGRTYAARDIFGIYRRSFLMPPPGQEHCIPAYWPEPGDEDVESFCSGGKKIYVVGNGRRAREQVEGFSNGRWRKAKSWAAAIQIWRKEYCDVYHTLKCPLNREMELSPKPVVSLPAPTSRREVDAHNAKVVFRTQKQALGYRTTKVNASEAAQMWGLVSPDRDFSKSPVQSSSRYRAPVSTPSPSRSRGPAATLTQLRNVPPNIPPSPLTTMDPAEAFARMGLGGDPSPAVEPRKQWAIAGVNRFFAERTDALDYILSQGMGQARLMGSRNVKKLRAFARERAYIPERDEVQYADDDE
ncbi:hypothetical protein B0H13DRAFT_1864716 [Mycena leptocephala]|nr:hypothetical protein B0H13DRAFT_1864716 [Mycena leptocephala]